MDRTPGRNEVRSISGDAEDISTRGSEIRSLGVQMVEAAGVLELVKDGAETRGKSLESIKDSVGDAAGDLKTAGERYEASGMHIYNYGAALSESRSVIDIVVPEAERLWEIYETKLAEFGEASGVPVPDVDPELPPGQPDPAEERTNDIEAARIAKDSAYEDWELEAGKYDEPYDNWVKAYEEARSGLETANDDGIEDSRWDNLLPAVEGILVVLSVAGAILAVAAIIFASPFLVIAGLVVGLVVLGLTIFKVAKGRGDGWDIAVAVVCILPFGKIAGAFKGIVKAPQGLRVVAAGRGGRDILTEMVGLTNRRQLVHLSSVARDGRAASVINAGNQLNRNGTRVLRARFAAMGNVSNDSTILQRILVGQEGVLSRNVSDALSGTSTLARNRVTAMLADSGSGRIVQDMIDGGRNVGNVDVLNVVDAVAKPAANFAWDQWR